MAKVLVPIDGSIPSLRAVDRVLKQIADGRDTNHDSVSMLSGSL